MNIDWQQLSLEQLTPFLLDTDLPESELISCLHELNIAFTQRKDLSKYVTDCRMVSAYTSFYLPTNIKKFYFLWQQLPWVFREDLSSRNFVDYGAGPGTYSLAFLDLITGKKENDLYLYDQSSLMLQQAEKIFCGSYPHKQNIYYGKLPSDFSNCILFFGHAINEIGVTKFNRMLQEYSPLYLAFIEPGNKDFFQIYLQIFQQLERLGYQNIYPCGQTIKCPLSKDDWCHQALIGGQHASIARLAQKVKLNRNYMPFIAHLYVKGKPQLQIAQSSQEGTVIRIYPVKKFAIEIDICFSGEKILRAQIMKKDVDSRLFKEYQGWHVGQKIKFDTVEQVNEKLIRILPTE